MKTVNIYNSDASKLVTINRELFTDGYNGYNYYLCLLIFNAEHSIYFINEDYKQTKTILTYVEAINEAHNLLSSHCPYLDSLHRKLLYAKEYHPEKIAYYEELIKQWIYKGNNFKF